MALKNTTGNQDRALENEVRRNPEGDYSAHEAVLEDLDETITALRAQLLALDGD